MTDLALLRLRSSKFLAQGTPSPGCLRVFPPRQVLVDAGFAAPVLPAFLSRVVPLPGTRLSTRRSSVPFSFATCGSPCPRQGRVWRSTRLLWPPPCSMCCGGGACESWVRFGVASRTRLSSSRWKGHHQLSHPGQGYCHAEPVG